MFLNSDVLIDQEFSYPYKKGHLTIQIYTLEQNIILIWDFPPPTCILYVYSAVKN